MSNIEIKNVCKKEKIPYWKIGDILGISDNTIVRWLRRPLSVEREKLLTDAVEALSRSNPEATTL